MAQDMQALVEQINKDEVELRLPSFTPDDAFEIGSAIRNLFQDVSRRPPEAQNDVYRGLSEVDGIVIHIETFTGHRLFSCTAGSPEAVKPDNWIWVEAKKNVVRRYHKSSYGVGRGIALSGKTPEDFALKLPEHAAHGGGFPIWIKGVTVAPVAVIIVSGLPQSMDHQLIVDALRAYVAKRPSQ